MLEIETRTKEGVRVKETSMCHVLYSIVDSWYKVNILEEFVGIGVGRVQEPLRPASTV